MKHTFLKHENCKVDNCIICDGGILYCTTCRSAEASLTTDCCGRKLTDYQESLVSQGVKDFKEGKWVRL